MVQGANARRFVLVSPNPQHADFQIGSEGDKVKRTSKYGSIAR